MYYKRTEIHIIAPQLFNIMYYVSLGDFKHGNYSEKEKIEIVPIIQSRKRHFFQKKYRKLFENVELIRQSNNYRCITRKKMLECYKE